MVRDVWAADQTHTDTHTPAMLDSAIGGHSRQRVNDSFATAVFHNCTAAEMIHTTNSGRAAVFSRTCGAACGSNDPPGASTATSVTPHSDTPRGPRLRLLSNAANAAPAAFRQFVSTKWPNASQEYTRERSFPARCRVCVPSSSAACVCV